MKLDTLIEAAKVAIEHMADKIAINGIFFCDSVWVCVIWFVVSKWIGVVYKYSGRGVFHNQSCFYL